MKIVRYMFVPVNITLFFYLSYSGSEELDGELVFNEIRKKVLFV